MPVPRERPLPGTMTERDGKERAFGENPYRSPETSLPATVETPDHEDERGCSGCLTLLLIALPLVDALGVLMSRAGPYAPVMGMVGFGGFACGAALGAYVSVRIKKQRWSSSCRWAIYGIIGMCLPAFILYAVLVGRL